MRQNFKVRDLKVYGSDEWMVDGTKKYRNVFDRYELYYIYVEFSFYNKLFDEDDWEIELTFDCFVNISNPRSICSLKQTRKVTKDENIVYVRESWGSPVLGSVWTMGDYKWEVTVNGQAVVAERAFHVEDLGPTALSNNEYIDVESVRLFESDVDIQDNVERKYYKTFKRDETRYVCAQLDFKNKANTGFYAEFFFKFYDKAGNLKGTTSQKKYFNQYGPDKINSVTSGWGSSVTGSWKEKDYSIEILYLDRIIAIVPFRVEDSWSEGNADWVMPNYDGTSFIPPSMPKATLIASDASLQHSLDELNAMIGLSKIKVEVDEMVRLVNFYKETGRDFLNRFSLHSVFTGNPGTGKTTVARLISKIYKALGILEKGHLVEVDREALVAGYIGQTAIKTKAKLDEALGGILFIDEAYSLAGERLGDNDFGAESISTILKYMEDNRGKIGIIVAGYTDKMREFVNSNPGLRSRFDQYFEFQDYLPDEMYHIATTLFAQESVTPDQASETHLRNYFTHLFKNRDKYFGNARTVRQVVYECVKNQHLRLASIPKDLRTPEMMAEIIIEDVNEFQITNEGALANYGIGFRRPNQNQE